MQARTIEDINKHTSITNVSHSLSYKRMYFNPITVELNFHVNNNVDCDHSLLKFRLANDCTGWCNNLEPTRQSTDLKPPRELELSNQRLLFWSKLFSNKTFVNYCWIGPRPWFCSIENQSDRLVRDFPPSPKP